MDAPAPGAATTGAPVRALTPGAVVLTPVTPSARPVAGSVTSFETGEAGLAVHLRAEVTREDADALDAQMVWATAHTGGRLVAFQGVAHRSGTTIVALNGVNAPIEEHRRRHLRAMTTMPARLLIHGPEPTAVLAGSTVDLSANGCRVQLSPDHRTGELPEVGRRVALVLDMSEETTTVATQVLRVDPAAGQAVLRFVTVAPDDADRIERHVLRVIT